VFFGAYLWSMSSYSGAFQGGSEIIAGATFIVQLYVTFENVAISNAIAETSNMDGMHASVCLLSLPSIIYLFDFQTFPLHKT
jgi:UDP-N-acetylmuramyl pentapeptide phosphotransferase/UDP-N-acetylglucosamine-1-phosphate transferase